MSVHSLLPSLLLCFLVIAMPLFGQSNSGSLGHPGASGMQIVFFGSVRAYDSGSEPIGLTACVQNSGVETSNAREFKIRLSCLAGLEYGTGEVIYPINELAKGQSQSFKWSVTARAANIPLVVSAILERNGQAVEIGRAHV